MYSFRLTNVIAEDFVNYKKPAMFISTAFVFICPIGHHSCSKDMQSYGFYSNKAYHRRVKKSYSNVK